MSEADSLRCMLVVGGVVVVYVPTGRDAVSDVHGLTVRGSDPAVRALRGHQTQGVGV